MDFFPIALILLCIDGPEIVNLKVKIILLSSKNLIGQKTPIEISGKTGPCVHKAIFFHLKSLVFIDKVVIAFFPIAFILYIDGPEIINLKVYLMLN